MTVRRDRRIAARCFALGLAFCPDSSGVVLTGGQLNPRAMAALCTSIRLEAAWPEGQQCTPFKAQPPGIARL